MQTTTSTRASTAQAVADHSPQRRPPRRAVEPDAAVAAATTAPTAAHPRALPNSVAVLKTPEARPRSSSPMLSVTATVRGTLAITKPASANSGPSRERSDAVGRIIGEFPLVVRFGEGSGPELVSGGGGVKGALGTILADVVVASSKGTWARIKFVPSRTAVGRTTTIPRAVLAGGATWRLAVTATRPGGTVERTALAPGKEVRPGTFRR
jgi:hypothetical protein